MSRYGEHSTGLDKFKIKIGKPIKATSSNDTRQSLDWLSSKALKPSDINKHPITRK